MGTGGFGIPGPGGMEREHEQNNPSGQDDSPGDDNCKHEWEKSPAGNRTYQCKKCGMQAMEQ